MIGNLSVSISRDNLEHLDRQSVQTHFLKLSETFKSVSRFVQNLDSMAVWCDAVIESLCSLEDIDSEVLDSLLETWTVNSSSKSGEYSRNAVSTVRETLLRRVDRYSTDKILRILHEIFNLVSDDEANVQLLNHELVLGLKKMKRKISESAVFNLMASEFLNGDFFPSSVSSISQFKSYKINHWIGFLKLALINTTTAIHYAVSEDDIDDAIICALLAAETIRIVSRCAAKLFQVYTTVRVKIFCLNDL